MRKYKIIFEWDRRFFFHTRRGQSPDDWTRGGHSISLDEKKNIVEISKIRRLSWKAYSSLSDMLQAQVAQSVNGPLTASLCSLLCTPFC